MNKRKKIAILTQPLHDNYGGLLQAYALKEVIQNLGFEVMIVNRRKWSAKGIRKIFSNVRNKIIGREFLTNKQQRIISKETLSFQKKYIPNLTNLIDTDAGMLQLNSMKINGYVIGSDQCWRPRYSPNIRNYFLDFVSEKDTIKISYAASFGVSDWEFNEQDTEICKNLIKEFNAVSVREKSGIDLIKKHLGRNDAALVLDPTLLLTQEHYKKITAQEGFTNSKGNLKVYVLDQSDAKKEMIQKIESELSLKAFEVLPNKRLDSEVIHNKNVMDFSFPNPAEWLRGFEDAEFVITDSFHGTIFSILFNIPFIAIGNQQRGMTRFESVLNIFNLNDRLVDSNLDNFDITSIIRKKINWSQVNEVLEIERIKSMEFLQHHLNQ